MQPPQHRRKQIDGDCKADSMQLCQYFFRAEKIVLQSKGEKSKSRYDNGVSERNRTIGERTEQVR